MIGDKLPENPEKNGFVFTGWNTAKDGSGQEVTDQTVVEGDMTVFAVFDDLKATDTWTLVYHWEDQDNLAGVRPALLTPRLIDESSSAHAADTQGNNVTFSRDLHLRTMYIRLKMFRAITRSVKRPSGESAREFLLKIIRLH